ncbi:TonB-dependent receptor plug domain-containing protein [Luteimonas panaciterrae]|uniref:TonB-dependent receptor plug domain-containing protein n=1 Tax=Luteimonas panaciterrae TaxID=363885 RepID=UPI001CFA09F7|nr:TonB-dependent receptor [Luteimonas panaciterrae]
MTFKRHATTARALMPLSALSLALLAALPAAARAQEPADQSAETKTTQLDTVEVVGSRARNRTAAEAPAPVDVISREQLQAAGVQEVGQALQMLEPSFNFSRTFVSDGTDILRPATLRALGPDQVLVLVNGKRRHQQALVNVQQTIGRGSAGTDINAIPITAIERVEVLRDGAAAQYGSDAISGVINIVLKRSTDTSGSLEIGQTYKGDGEVIHGGINTGFALADDGFLNFTFEYRDRGETNRAGPDTLRVNPPRVTQRLGDADAKDAYLWLNGGLPIGKGELYWFGGYSKRKGDSSGFFRSAGDNRTVPELYPDGFLPNILTTVEDTSLALGYRAPLGESWNWDVSVNKGRNKFGFVESNSVNVSWWYEPKPGGGIYAESPTSADTGTLQADQTTFNLDFRGPINWGIGEEPLYLATGVEYRKDDYKITPGDPVSYTYGRTNDRSIPILGQAGETAQPGMQGFPGFSPTEAVDDGRHNYAVYLDAETRLTKRFLIGAAVRFEDYSDFGNTTTGKLSLRFDATEKFAIRGTLATGFRAPGVQQLFYSQRSTNLDPSGVLVDTLTARQDSDVTRAFGIQPLKEEESVSGTLGVVFKPNENTTFTVDVFRIDIDDRIIFSSNIVPESGCVGPGDPNCPIANILNPLGVGQVLFFTNAIDTKTQGIDIVGEHSMEFGEGSRLDLTALLHWNKTEVTKRKSQSAILPPDKLFDDTQVTLIEQGQPRAHHVLQGVYTVGDWSFLARANYFGSVSGEGFTPGIKQTWGGEWLGDIAIGYRFNDSLKLTIGANNVFDAYPDKWDPVKGAPFPQLGFKYGWETLPFGTNGGYYYAKLDFRF